MVSTTKRKVFEIGRRGHRSKALTIPKEWADGTEIEKGDAVEVWYNGVMLVVPRDYPRKERVLALLRGDGP
jgi:bifunctional DNA-binding transcriptional regulator/antitoxin component of YhaV-PrlF toxin-antitoxin module